MLTIFVTNYWQLFTLRLLTGIAVGGGWVDAGGPACSAPHACLLLPPLARLPSPTVWPTPPPALPVVFSLLGDLYDPSRRAGVSSIVQLSTGIGLAAGQGIAGFVGALDVL